MKVPVVLSEAAVATLGFGREARPLGLRAVRGSRDEHSLFTLEGADAAQA